MALCEMGSWDIGFQALATVGAASGCARKQGVFRKLQVVQNGEPYMDFLEPN